MTPSISVVVPAYNAGATIERTLHAFRSQTVESWQAIVVDDGSVDDTVEAAHRVRDERIRIVTTAHAGVSAARNRGIEASIAPLVTFIDADDIPLTEWLENILEPFTRERVGVVCCPVIQVLDDGTESVVEPSNHPRHGRVLFLSGTFASRRELLTDGYDERLAFGENTEFGGRLLAEADRRGYETSWIEEPLVRWHVDRRRGDMRDAARLASAEIVLQEHGSTMSTRMTARHQRIAAVNAARIGDLRRARTHAFAALRSEPLDLRSWTTVAGAWVTPLGDRWSRPSPGGASTPTDSRDQAPEAAVSDRDSRAPRVSVLMPVYNGESTIGDAIQSILVQTLHDFELIVVDDGSTDGTGELLGSYRDDSRVRIVTSPSNQGLVAALRLGLSHCRGELVARLDADDLARPKRLDRQVRVFDDPSVVLCATAYDRVSDDGRLLKHSVPPSSHGEVAAAMLSSNRLHHSSVMFRREAVAKVGGYDAQWFPVEDYDLWLRLLDTGRYVGIETTESVYVQNDTGISASRATEQSRRQDERAALYRTALTGRPPQTGRITGTLELARSALSLRRRLRRRRITTRGVDRQTLRAINHRLSSDRRLVRMTIALVAAPRVAVLGRWSIPARRR